MKFVFAIIIIVAFANLNATPINIDDDGAHYRNIDEEFYRQKMTEILVCSSNNFGCLDYRCWANCGPRLEKHDWCFTTKAGHKSCERDEDCDPCWTCVSKCYKEAGASINNNNENSTSN